MVRRRLPSRALPPSGWLAALALPQRGGSLEHLASLLNLSSQNDFVLVVTWLLAALRPSGPYPLLAVSGEQGSAKTILSKMLRALVDPNAAPVRALPREERELFIAANNGHVLAFDNISRLRSWLSDALCRLASGGGFAVRQLYTDQDEMLFDAARPVLLNSIEEVITRPDLADRSIFLTLPPVAAHGGSRSGNYGGNSNWHIPTSSAPSSIWLCTGCAHCPGLAWIDCPGWLILRSGQRPVKRPFGLLELSAAPMRPTASL